MTCYDLGGDLADDREQFVQKVILVRPQVKQRSDVPLRNDDNVHVPAGASVSIGKYIYGLAHTFDLDQPTQDVLAVKIFAHKDKL